MYAIEKVEKPEKHQPARFSGLRSEKAAVEKLEKPKANVQTRALWAGVTGPSQGGMHTGNSRPVISGFVGLCKGVVC